MKKIGILLVNLGTPDAPTPSAVRRYLCEFLSDKRVIKSSGWLWKLLLFFIIAPLRSRKSAKAYESIWTDEGSPLLTYTRNLTQKVAKKLDGNYHVDFAMTYGKPSINSKLAAMQKQGIEKIKVLPLYPQYSGTTTGAVIDAVARATKKLKFDLPIEWYHDYATHPAYIQAISDSIKENWDAHGRMQKLIFSFHGIPEKYIKDGDVYLKRTQATISTLTKSLGLTEENYQLCFQSRFGPTKWLQPYTQETLATLPNESIRSIDVICPGFSVDCLETIEEINIENRETFMEAGGKIFRYIPCLNDSDSHADMLVKILTQ